MTADQRLMTQPLSLGSSQLDRYLATDRWITRRGDPSVVGDATVKPRYLVYRDGWVTLSESEAAAELIAAGPPRRPRRVDAPGGMTYDDL